MLPEILRHIPLLSQHSKLITVVVNPSGLIHMCQLSLNLHCVQGVNLSGKPGNVRAFDSCQGNVRDFTKSQGSVREKNVVRKKLPKTVRVSCIFASILDLAEFVHFILVSNYALLHSYPTTDNNTSTSIL